MTDTFKDWLIERNVGLLRLDLEWARKRLFPLMGGPTDDVTLLVSMHKARVDCVSLPDEPRRESARWLLERGFKRMTGEEPDPDNLPTGAT
jgi:hypothetical protein